MHRKSNKKELIYRGIFCLMLFCLTGCTDGRKKEKAENTEGVSWFAPYTQSFVVGDNEFDLLFYCNEADKSVWEEDNIEEVSIQVGQSNTTIMSVENIELADDGEYCKGVMKVAGQFEQEYKEKIEKSLDETTFDEINKDAYKKKRVSSIKKTIDLRLKKGEYYIYFPLVFISDETPGLNRSVIKLKYTNSRENSIHFISNCFPYFSEFSKSEMILKDIFSSPT